MTAADQDQTLTFIQYDIPPLKSGEYTLDATQTLNQGSVQSYKAAKTIAVPGNRFQLNADDIVSVFPAPLANGEFTGSMPLVALKRTTLPWQRTSVMSDQGAPWLAVFLFESADAPTLHPGTAADLVPTTASITVAGSSAPGVQGKMPALTVSCPGLDKLDYGQSPSDPCQYIDVPAHLFDAICPSAVDLPLLAHIRETDTYDSADAETTVSKVAVILGNRWAAPNTEVQAFLVSLENMGPLLPDETKTPPSQLPAGTAEVRLIVFRTWKFFANDLGEKFQSLCEHLNRDASGLLGLTTLRLPGAVPDPAAVQAALADQAKGSLSDADADVLVANALGLGYCALDHRLLHAGRTVSWYRGPLVPCPVASGALDSAPCADALSRYDPDSGLFDVSYAQAWQLGQLMALQSGAFSVALYTWKHSLQKQEAAKAELQRVDVKLGAAKPGAAKPGAAKPGAADVMPSFFARLRQSVDTSPDIPAIVSAWIARRYLLIDVPFAALVADERMLPVESLRFFYLDPNWIDALIDGAFSIGRSGPLGTARDLRPLAQVKATARGVARGLRRNNHPAAAAALAAAGNAPFGVITGCLLRSQLVANWPGLKVVGSSGGTDLTKLRMSKLSSDVLMILFDGDVDLLEIHEAPGVLHCGVEGDAASGFTTTLRQLMGDTPGQEYLSDPKGGPPVANVSVRSDNQTLNASLTASAIQTKLLDFGQSPPSFTSAQFALEMVQGVVKVEFKRQ